MKLNPFKKEDPLKKEKDVVFNEVMTRTRTEIREIDKISDPVVRIARYKAASQKLEQFHDGSKPGTVDGEGVSAGAFAGGLGGVLVGMFACVAAPHVALPVFLGVIAAGAAGGGGIGNLSLTKEQRELLTEKYGSVKNAQNLYNLHKMLAKKIEKDTSTLNDVKAQRALEKRAAQEAKKKAKAEKKAEKKNAPQRSLESLQDQFDKTFNGKPAPVKQEPAAQPETPVPVQKKIVTGAPKLSN